MYVRACVCVCRVGGRGGVAAISEATGNEGLATDSAR